MGAHKNIDFIQFPRQGAFLGKRVKVMFHFETEAMIEGLIVRDDAEEPGRLIIKLDDDRYVLASECQYTFD